MERAREATKADRIVGDLAFEPFCAQRLKIQTKQGELVPLHLNRAQQHLHANLTGRDLVLKARHVGVSTYVQARFFYAQMQGGARTNTLCHEDELTSEIRLMADRFYDNLPEQPERHYASARLNTYPRLNSQARIATVGGVAGRKKGRGGSVTHLHGSEVAFWPNAAHVLAAAMQAGNPEIVLESTPNGMMGWFYEECMAALRGDSVWALHFYPWWWEDEYRIPLIDGETVAYTDEEQRLVNAHGLDAEQINWRRQKQAELKDLFAQEYPEDPVSCFLASGRSYFGDVEHVFCAPPGAVYNPEHEYVAGLDFGQTNDYTTLLVIDATTLEQVDLLHVNNEPWQDMRRQISAMANYWHARVIGEGNSMGTTNTELLQSGEVLDNDTRIAPVDLEVFFTSPVSKPPLIQDLRHAIQEVGLTLLDIPVQRHEIRAFVTRRLPAGGWAYEGGDGAHDDTVIALALAWHGKQQGAYVPGQISYAPRYTIGGGSY